MNGLEMIEVDYKDLDGSENPVSNYCRQLIAEGVNPNISLKAYKNGKLNMIVGEIGKAAKVCSDGIRFREWRNDFKMAL